MGYMHLLESTPREMAMMKSLLHSTPLKVLHMHTNTFSVFQVARSKLLKSAK